METKFNDVQTPVPLRNGVEPAVAYVRYQDLPNHETKEAFESLVKELGWEFEYERMHVAGELYSHVYYLWKV